MLIGRAKHLLALYLVSFVVFSSWADSVALPQLGHPERQAFSEHDEIIAGYDFIRQIPDHVVLLNDPILNQYLSDIGQQVINASNLKDRHFHFFWVNDASINAFAAPHGYIGFHTGLLLATQNEEEVAAVVAHEIAHVSQNHIARTLHRNNEESTPALLTGLALLAAGVQSNSISLGLAGALSGVAQQYEQALAHSRDLEREADQIGQQILLNAGYSTLPMINFFSRLYEQDKSHSTPEFLRTHPLSEARLSEAASRAQQLHNHPLKENLTFKLMQERALFLTGQNSEVRTSKEVQNYYKALALLKDGQYQALNQVLLKHQHILFQWIALEAALKRRDREEVKQWVEKLSQTHPNHLMLHKAWRYLGLEGDAVAALSALKMQVEVSVDPALTLSFIAEIYAHGKERALYLIYQAKAAEHRGEILQADALYEQVQSESEDWAFKQKIELERERILTYKPF